MAQGVQAEIVVSEEAAPSQEATRNFVNNTPPYPMSDVPVVVIVRAEEVLLVVLVLMIWVAAIALFFNRWGKIRMLEPYQPKFQQSHRASCPMGEPGIPAQQRMSFSKYNVNCLGGESLYSALPSPNPYRRPRQNSVFVGGSTMAVMNPPRRAKSAMDIQHLILNEHRGSLSHPMLPSERRPSITVERPPLPPHPTCQFAARHRTSLIDQSPRFIRNPERRRPSCIVDNRPYVARHRHFISFDQTPNPQDRRTSITIERPSCSRHPPQPTISLEAPSEIVVDPPAIPSTSTSGIRKISYSLDERPSTSFENPGLSNRPGMSASLDASAIRFATTPPPEDDRSSPVTICLDDSQITAPLLESLKSTDV